MVRRKSFFAPEQNWTIDIEIGVGRDNVEGKEKSFQILKHFEILAIFLRETFPYVGTYEHVNAYNGASFSSLSKYWTAWKTKL